MKLQRGDGLLNMILKIHIFPLTFTVIHQSKLFWCELPSFRDIGHRDFCLFSSIMGLHGALNVLVTDTKNTIEKLNSNVSFQKS